MTQRSTTRLQAEAERLRALIEESHKRLREIETLMGLLNTYGDFLDTGAQPASQVLLKWHGSSQRRTTLKDRILNTSEEVLADGLRRLSRDLLPELAKRGVRIHGRDPAANLASYLSREKDRFISDQKAGGWTLRRLPLRGSVASSTAVASSGVAIDVVPKQEKG